MQYLCKKNAYKILNSLIQQPAKVNFLFLPYIPLLDSLCGTAFSKEDFLKFFILQALSVRLPELSMLLFPS